MNDIRNARSSVKIVSPFLSPFLVRELIDLNSRNIAVSLITTDDIEDFYGSYKRNIHELIIQNRQTDFNAQALRNKWKDLVKTLTYINFGLVALFLGVSYYVRDVKMALGAIPVLVIYLIIRFYKSKITQTRIYYYRYKKLFPFKVYMSPEAADSSNTFIHGKLYIIDDRIAYLGSLNFTGRGTKDNYETRIRTTDFEAVKELVNEFNQLLHYTSLPEKDTQVWGRELYMEPIN